MIKNSLGFTIFKFIATLLILFFLGMIYWSLILLEDDMKHLTTSFRDLKQEVEGMRIDTQKMRTSLGEISSNKAHDLTSRSSSNEERSESISEAKYSHMDPKLPNLFEKDLFYKKTLPLILGDHFRPFGIRHEGRLGHPENFHPFNAFRDVGTMVNMCTGSIAEMQFGKYETLAPSLAIKMEAKPLASSPKAFEYWVFLRDDLFWQPLKEEHFPKDVQLDAHFLQKHKVTAYDFKFFYDAIMNPSVEAGRAFSLRSYYADIEEFRVIDPLTFVVRWKQEPIYDFELGKEVPKVRYSAKGLTGSLQPLAQFVFQYFADGKKIVEEDQDPMTYQTNSVWAQNFTNHWAKNVIPSCGPWQFGGSTDEGILFQRNSDYFDSNAVLVNGLNYTFKENLEGIWQDFKSGKSDMLTLSPSQLPEYEEFLKSPAYAYQRSEGLAIRELDYVDKSFFYIGWNQATPWFEEREVRKAMTLAIDRNRIIAHNLNEMGVAITGPFYRYSPAYDPSIEAWPYDPDEAKRILDHAGWIDRDGSGIRGKIIDGKQVPFRFTLTYYAKSFAAKVVSEYIATTLKEIGVECRLSGIDITDISRLFEDKSFDALYMGWALAAPPEEPRQIWHSSGSAVKGSSNAVSFKNKEADKIIEALEYEYDPEKRKALYHRFHSIIHHEQPYTFLYSPKVKLLYREYVKNLFIPRDRQDLIPEADVSEPDYKIIYITPHPES